MSRGAPSLVARLTLVQVGVLATLWLLIILATVLDVYRRDHGDIDVELRALATGLANVAKEGDTPADNLRLGREFTATQRLNSDPITAPAEIAYQLWSADGHLLARSVDHPTLPALAPAVSLAADNLVRSGWYAYGAWNRSHSLYAVVAKQVSYYRRRVRSTVTELVGLWMALAVLSASAFWIAFRMVIRPLRELARQVQARSAADLSPMPEHGSFVEVKPLLTALNQKLTRIRTSLDAERQFFADAAHELRTPLSVVSAQAHVLAHEPEFERRLSALRQIEAGMERSARVISRLLLLGRLQGREGVPQRVQHDVSALAAGVVEGLAAVATSRGQQLHLNCDSGVEASCDSQQIATLIENLVDNALRYCPPGSTVQVTVKSLETQTLIGVSDDGPGIAPDDRERAFARFGRLGTSDTPGSGLGLAIVRQIAELHGGTARILESQTERGTRIEIRF